MIRGSQTYFPPREVLHKAERIAAMADKFIEFPVCICRRAKTVTGFGQRNLFGDGDVEKSWHVFTETMAQMRLLMFAISSGDAEHEQAIANIREHLCGMPKYRLWQPDINRMEDVKKLLYAGCARVVLNFAKASNVALLEGSVQAFRQREDGWSVSPLREEYHRS